MASTPRQAAQGRSGRRRRRDAQGVLYRESDKTSSLPGRRMGSTALNGGRNWEVPHRDGSDAGQANRWFEDEYAFDIASKATCG